MFREAIYLAAYTDFDTDLGLGDTSSGFDHAICRHASWGNLCDPASLLSKCAPLDHAADGYECDQEVFGSTSVKDMRLLGSMWYQCWHQAKFYPATLSRSVCISTQDSPSPVLHID
jgi:hypothetical protein